MNVDEALDYALGCSQEGSYVDILATEVKRLREQREVLYDVIPDDRNMPGAVLLIIEEMFPGKKDKMTVDQAISDVESPYTATPQEEVLVTEVKRLQNENYMLRQVAPSLRAVSNDEWNSRLLERDEKIVYLRQKIKDIGKVLFDTEMVLKAFRDHSGAKEIYETTGEKE